MKNSRGSDFLIIVLMLMAFLAYAGCAGGSSDSRIQPDVPSASPGGAASAVTRPETPTLTDPVTGEDVSSATNSDPDNVTPASPAVTDHSFWRLAKQGEVTIPRRIADSIQLGQEWRSTRCYELADFPELDFASASSDRPTEYYVIHSDTAQPGEVVCRLHYAEADYVISVPVLDDALSEYLNERGESCVMLYSRHADGSEEAELAFYWDSAYILVPTGPKGSRPFVGTGYFGSSAGLSSYLTGSSHGDWDWGCDMVLVSCSGDRCCSESTVKILYDQTAGQIMHERGTESDSTAYAIVDQLAEFTETSYTTSPIQLQTLKDAVTEFEARPLPDYVLERFID